MGLNFTKIHIVKAIILGSLWLFISGCEVKLVAPDEPITINLNVKVEHDIDVKVDEELELLIKQNPELF